MRERPDRRLPFGVAAVACACLAAVPVWTWDRLENTAGLEGPNGLAVIVGLFVATWLLVMAILSAASPRPLAEGALAGVLVALVMAYVLIRIVASLDGSGNWPLVVIFGVPFYALAIGLGCASGFVAQRLQHRGVEPAPPASPAAPAEASVASLRRAGVVCIMMGVLLFLGTAMFFLPLFSTLLFLPAILAGALVAIGLWALVDASRRKAQGAGGPTGPD